MKLIDILKSVGSAAIQVAMPGTGSLLVAGLNELLPAESKLPVNPTGTDVSNAIASLPPEQRASVLEREFDVEVVQIEQSNQTLRAMLESDAANPHSTRPKIAYQAFQVVAIISLGIVAIWAIAALRGDHKTMELVNNGYVFVGIITSPFILWLNSYFGILKTESKDRLNAASGLPEEGPSLINSAVSKFLTRK